MLIEEFIPRILRLYAMQISSALQHYYHNYVIS